MIRFQVATFFSHPLTVDPKHAHFDQVSGCSIVIVGRAMIGLNNGAKL